MDTNQSKTSIKENERNNVIKSDEAYINVRRRIVENVNTKKNQTSSMG